MSRAGRLAGAAAGAVALAMAGGWWFHRARQEIRTPVDLSSVEHVRSDACAVCHPFRHETWERTFHRTMTQVAGRESVLGDFENASYRYQGVTSRFTREGDRYFLETLDVEDPGGGRLTQYEVVLTVGSRRVQQYVTRIGERHIRLPLAWNVEEGRWFHLAGGFLHPDGSDFHTHTGLWDANCIFCHNVKANPAFDPVTEGFSSTVAEHGIACEACHGPGALHAARNRDPLRRYLLHLGGERDPTSVSPHELGPERQVQLCGHCHGQRLPRPRSRLREFLMEGDPYTAGADLNEFTEPIWAHTELPGVDLSLRFWNDGTPRLTAYEYQSLLMTRDYTEGGLTCIHCHSMHGGDPRGMITEEMRGKAACASCHPSIVEDVASHTHHEPDGPGSDCYACHMPRITYGLLETHPTHRIQVPDPSRAWRHDMPEACTLCHTNRSAAWAAEAATELFGAPESRAPRGDFRDVAESVRSLLAGDVVQRAVAAKALAAGSPYGPGAPPLWPVPFLILTMEDDYPAIRGFAHQGLTGVVERAGLEAPRTRRFDPLADPARREAIVGAWWAWWRALDKSALPPPARELPLDPDFLPVAEVVSRLKAERDDRIIAIGE